MNESTSLLEDRIERSLHQLAESLDPHLELPDVMRDRGTYRHSRRWIASVAAASVVVVGLGGLWLGRADDPPATVPTSIAEVDEAMPYFLPGSVPPGFELDAADHRVNEPSPNPRPAVVLALRTDDGGFRNPIRVRTLSQPITDGEVAYEHEPLQLRNGTPAELLRDVTNGTSVLQWTTADGTTVAAFNDVIANQADTATLLTAVADAVTVVGNTVRVSEPRPAGELVAVEPATYPGTESQLVYGPSDTEGPSRLLFVTVTIEPPAGWQFLSMGDSLARTEIVGQPAFVTEHNFPQHQEEMLPTRTVMWLAQPNVLITVSGQGFAFDELIALAATLTPVDEATWLEVTGNSDPSTT